MEAATLPARPAVRGDRVKAFVGTYGLILLLLALPVYFGIYDLVHDGNLTRLGNNLVRTASQAGSSGAGTLIRRAVVRQNYCNATGSESRSGNSLW